MWALLPGWVRPYGLPSVVPRADSERELCEGSREPMLGSNVGGKFVVAGAKVLNKRRARR
jgi:hypothetical protein